MSSTDLRQDYDQVLSARRLYVVLPYSIINLILVTNGVQSDLINLRRPTQWFTGFQHFIGR